MSAKYFERINGIITSRQFDQVDQLNIPRPEYFNWTAEVFEGIWKQKTPEKTALIIAQDTGDETYSYRQLSERANQLLNYLRSKGMEKGDRIFIMLPVCVENWLVYLAAIKGGFVLVPAPTNLTENDLVYRFEKSFPQAILSDEASAGPIDRAFEKIGKSPKVRLSVLGQHEGWSRFGPATGDQPVAAEPGKTRASDPLFMFFTSGTTGMPKIVVHTHTYPIGHLTTNTWIGIRQDDIHYNISKAGWAKFAWSSFFAPFNVGATVFYYNAEGPFQAADQLRKLQDYKITTFCCPPTALRLMVQEDLTAYQFRLRECVAAGEPLNPEVIESWKKGTGLLIRDGYGQSESTAMVANLPGARVKYGSMGKPTFLYDIVIANDNGEIQPDLEEGIICVRLKEGQLTGIFNDYFGDPRKKASVFRNGLYYTGDKAYRDEEGYIWFVGRGDDVIKASDYRIGPFEVESVLIEHPQVVEAAVIGSPHDIRGFEVKAYLVVKDHPAADAALAGDLFKFTRSKLAKYKIPRIIEFVEELPKTVSGKIRRVELRAEEQQKKHKKIRGPKEYFYGEND